MDKCMYCEKDERLDALMYPVTSFENADLYLYREGSYPGRCILVPKKHLQHLTEMEDEERNDFFSCAMRTARAIEKIYSPVQINYLFFGDGLPHLHLHLVPKYRDGLDFGKLFQMMPENAVMMDNDECEAAASRLREAI